MPKIYDFPPDFVWGTATSAHQTEGSNKNSDWWQWEVSKQPGQKYPLEPSYNACDSYNRYEEDMDLCKQLNNNAYRFSIEWARIEPEEGKFDEQELNHYKSMLNAAKKRGLKTFVTLHHFTSPIWLAKKGGWMNIHTPSYFARYAKKIAETYGDLIDAYVTINEPQVYVLLSYVKGYWPPNKSNPFSQLIVQFMTILAHNKAYKSIKNVDPNLQVGLVKNISWFDAYQDAMRPLSWLISKILYWSNSDAYLFFVRKNLDFLGLNYYFTTRLRIFDTRNKDDVQNDLGWWVYPTGLEKVLLALKKYNLPIYITENGCADASDRIRKDFIKNMLIASNKALKQGVQLKGYFYWSLLDNYEWHEGYWPKFGLVYIDRGNNLQRVPREAFYYYANICKTGRVIE